MNDETKYSATFTPSAKRRLASHGVDPETVRAPIHPHLSQGDLVSHPAFGQQVVLRVASRTFAWNADGSVTIDVLFDDPPARVDDKAGSPLTDEQKRLLTESLKG